MSDNVNSISKFINTVEYWNSSDSSFVNAPLWIGFHIAQYS